MHARESCHRLWRGGQALTRGLLVGALASPAIAGSPYTFVNIADNTGDLGNSFSNPSINSSGTVVFAASIGGGQTGIFTGNGGALTTIVLGGVGNYHVSSFVGINDSDLVTVRVSENISEEGIYTGDGGPLVLVAVTDENPYQVTELPFINAPGQVVFYGVVVGGTSGIYRAQSFGNYTTIADTSGSFVSFTGRASLNDGGTAAFYANGDTVSGIYTGDGGALTTIVETDATFTSVGSVMSINDDGTVAFFAGNVSKQGIYTGNGGPLTPVADTDGDFMLFTFGDACINNNGSVAFIATTDSGSKGIFTGPDVAAEKVIQVGDPLFGSTLSYLPNLIGPRAMNDDGDIAFVYYLDDERTGVAVAQAGGGAPCPDIVGDDNVVDVQDFLALLAAWGPCDDPCPPSCAADTNGDCVVDVQDFLAVLAAWGPCP
jgi:hypothetical protein